MPCRKVAKKRKSSMRNGPCYAAENNWASCRAAYAAVCELSTLSGIHVCNMESRRCTRVSWPCHQSKLMHTYYCNSHTRMVPRHAKDMCMLPQRQEIKCKHKVRTHVHICMYVALPGAATKEDKQTTVPPLEGGDVNIKFNITLQVSQADECTHICLHTYVLAHI